MTTETESAMLPGLSPDSVDQLAVDTIRFLAADMVEAANSGHPGMPMGSAPMAWTLFSRHLKFDPAAPDWSDRDRFVLSAGHGSALQYALLHMFGYDLPLQELKDFRQLNSMTPGHPEYGHTPGVETTTGPLGQGLATAVGLALAERMHAARFPDLVDHRTYVIAGDGCLMEGVSHEAASLAGQLGLGRLIVLFDDNQITIDGDISLSCRDDQLARFTAYGWQVLRVEDGTDLVAIDKALTSAKSEQDRPTLIAVRTVIGHGAPGIEGTSKAHGSPLGPDVLGATKLAAGWDSELFVVPDAVQSRCVAIAQQGAQVHAGWRSSFDQFAAGDPGAASTWSRTLDRELPNLDEALSSVSLNAGPRATRQASQAVLRAAAELLPELVGGSADLAGSTGTQTGQRAVTASDFGGAQINFGIREFAMAATLNGLSLHGGFRTYGSTFLVFSDYMRAAIRLSALMKQPVIYILTHDSVAVGEDGPTHQPVEHIESLRLIPNVTVLRPADDTETLAAWKVALRRLDGPTVLVLSRQSVPPLLDVGTVTVKEHGARVVHTTDEPQVDLFASGSEVSLAVEAAQALVTDGIRCRVVSVVDRERFFASPGGLARAPLSAAVEAGVTHGWRAYVDAVVGIDTFGASGPGNQVLEAMGITTEAVISTVRRIVSDFVGNGAGSTPKPLPREAT